MNNTFQSLNEQVNRHPAECSKFLNKWFPFGNFSGLFLIDNKYYSAFRERCVSVDFRRNITAAMQRYYDNTRTT